MPTEPFFAVPTLPVVKPLLAELFVSVPLLLLRPLLALLLACVGEVLLLLLAVSATAALVLASVLHAFLAVAVGTAWPSGQLLAFADPVELVALLHNCACREGFAERSKAGDCFAVCGCLFSVCK